MIRRPPNIPFQLPFKPNAVGYVVRNPFDQSRTANLVLAWGVTSDLGVLDVDSNTHPFPVKVEMEQKFFPESVTLTICNAPYQSEVFGYFPPESPPPKTTVAEATNQSFEGTLV
ncbi:hypothetical protein NX722_00620 [Endozoicomonas gorgoniicola]|uniref:MSP domain-containing protein n=1 Tax=Endozoicomonas gorgoniicola TaxID=1234144 RepID=A0ABT3MP82_9GAMM|nr:hypothetical protein [Endozoicomonas gorgoniicola]MCW7551185.1 hypothetical protein [Endozoicomonas gorgoniicola]